MNFVRNQQKTSPVKLLWESSVWGIAKSSPETMGFIASGLFGFVFGCTTQR